jgi:hypothetical protein
MDGPEQFDMTEFGWKGAGNIEYGDIENGEIEKTGTSKKKWGTKF